MNTQVIRRIKNVIRCRDNGTALSKKTRWCIELVGLVCASVMVHVGSYVVPLLIILYCLTKWHIDAPLIWLDVIIHYLQVQNVLTKLIKHSSVTWQTKSFLLRWRWPPMLAEVSEYPLLYGGLLVASMVLGMYMQRQLLCRWPFSFVHFPPTWSFGNANSMSGRWFLSSKWWDYPLCTRNVEAYFQVHISWSTAITCM